jgi:hypothetical protein
MSSMPHVQLPIFHVPRVASVRNAGFLYALENRIALVVTDMKRIVVGFK